MGVIDECVLSLVNWSGRGRCGRGGAGYAFKKSSNCPLFGGVTAVEMGSEACIVSIDDLLFGQGVELRLGEEAIGSLHHRGWKGCRNSYGGWVLGTMRQSSSDLGEGAAFLAPGNGPTVAISGWGSVEVESPSVVQGGGQGHLGKPRDLRAIGGNGDWIRLYPSVGEANRRGGGLGCGITMQGSNGMVLLDTGID